MFKACAAIGLVALLTAEAAHAQTSSGPAYRPHRAVYEVTLVPGRSGGDRNRIEAGRGRLVYEFMGSACEGWTTNLRFVTELRFGENQSHVTDIRSNTFETGRADEFRFVTRSDVNNRTRDEADGTARRDAGSVRVELRRPQARSSTVPGEVLFPTQHMTAALEAARRGERIFAADIFDGSEGGQKVFETTAVFRRAITTIAEGHPTNVEPLRGMPRWPMTISFFDRARSGGGEQVPLYELTVEVFEAGITHSILIDYGEFALRGTMTSLELLPESSCR